MTRLRKDEGTIVDVGEELASRLLGAGWSPVAEQQDIPPRQARRRRRSSGERDDEDDTDG